MLSVGGIPGFTSGSALVPARQQLRDRITSGARIDLQDIVSEFLQGDMLRMDSVEDEWSGSLATDLHLDVGPFGQDFDTWFEGLFGSEGIRSSIDDYLREH